MSASIEFLSGREHIDIDMFQQAGYKLPEIMLSLNTATPFVQKESGAVVAQCLLEDKNYYMDVSHVAYGSEDALVSLLNYVADFSKKEGRAYIEIGCGNADVEMYLLFQRMGFRVVGVRTDFYLSDAKTVDVLNSIANIDMIRFRLNLKAKRLSTIGYDASGRT